MMKKLNWKPWQIILSAIAGVAVIGGGAAGIWYGVDQAVDNKVAYQVNAALETATAEPVLDEPTATAAETETKTEKETDTVNAAPSESESQSKNIDQEMVEEIEPDTDVLLDPMEKVSKNSIEQ